MVKELRVAAFDGGKLRFLREKDAVREIMLALPLSRTLVKMLKIAVDQDLAALAEQALKSSNPYPDETLSVCCETVRETEYGSISLAAAFPEGSSDDIAAALDEAKVNVCRIDILELGFLRMRWGDIRPDIESESRKVVIVENGGGAGIIILDGDTPSSVRTVSDCGSLSRELMLSLLEAEDFGGERKIDEIVYFGTEAPAQLGSFAPIRLLPPMDIDTALEGVAQRSEEENTLNILPASWQEVLEETRFKSKLLKAMTAAGGLWLVVLAVILGGPVVLGFMTDSQKELCRGHRSQYREVAQVREKVKIVRKYSDHAQGALRIMKLVSDCLPESVELATWDFTRSDGENVGAGVRFRGSAENRSDITQLKTRLEELEIAEEGQEEPRRLFGSVTLGSISTAKNGIQNFDIDCRYEAEEAPQ
jgi:hypothetical protein